MKQTETNEQQWNLKDLQMKFEGQKEKEKFEQFE